MLKVLNHITNLQVLELDTLNQFRASRAHLPVAVGYCRGWGRATLPAAVRARLATAALLSVVFCQLPIVNCGAVLVLRETIMPANAVNTLAISAFLQLLLFTNYS